MIDLGTGNNNKINWAMTDKQEFIDIVEVIYRGARKGRGLVVRRRLGHVCLLCLLLLCQSCTEYVPPSNMSLFLPQVSPKDYSTKYRY